MDNSAIHFILSRVLFAFLFIVVPVSVFAQTSLDVGGYLQSWYISNEKTQTYETQMGMLPIMHTPTAKTNGFRLRRARIMAKGSINETFSVTSWVELATNSPSLLCFYANVHFNQQFNLRIGQIMMPGQSYDTSRNASSWLLFYERPMISTKLSSTMGYDAFRDIGVMAYGQIGRLWYGVHAGNGAGRFQQASSNITERNFGGGLYGARVDFELFDGFTLGSHVSTNQQRDVVQNNHGPFDIDRTSYSFRVATNNLGLNGLFSHIEYMSLTTNDTQNSLPTLNGDNYNLHGFYGELGYKITDNWQIVGRYDTMVEKPYQQTENLVIERSELNNYTLGISRFIVESDKELARIHLNYSFGQRHPYDLDHSILVLVFQLRFIP